MVIKIENEDLSLVLEDVIIWTTIRMIHNKWNDMYFTMKEWMIKLKICFNLLSVNKYA